MHPSRTRKRSSARFVAFVFIMLTSVILLAQTNNNKDKKPASNPPAKPAPAKPAPPPPRPAGGSSSGVSRAPSTGTGARTGPTTGNTGVSRGPTTANSGTNRGPTTANSGINRGPTTANPGTSRGPTANGATANTSIKPGTNGGKPGATNSGNGPANGTKGPTASTSINPGTNGGKPGTNGGKPGANNAANGTNGSSTSRNINGGGSGRPLAKGMTRTELKGGSSFERRSNGRLSDVHDARRGMDVHRGINGNRSVAVERRDHSRLVAERGRPGYIHRGYSYHGRDYARRTYYYHGRVYDRYYRGYGYRGVYLNVYAPVRYYPVGFYGWVYNPWYTPVVYPWGWVGSPWYGYYGGYFTPYPVYPTASLWLTDYLISRDLEAAYQARQEAQIQGEQLTGAAPLTPEVKQMIADEVKNQIALENAEAQQNARNQEPDPGSSGIARMLSDGRAHVFVAGAALDVVDTSGNECAISDGDALQMTTPPPPDATSANLVVLSSKGGRECAKSATVQVSLNDLQDMQNHMRETIDQGMQELQTKQGSGGLPAAPPSARTAPVDVGFTKEAPPPDPNGAAEVNQQLAEADQAEKEVVSQAGQETEEPSSRPAAPSGPAGGTVTVALGQSIAEVRANFGAPLTVIDLGPKKIYKYKDMQVTFKDGKVSDVK